MLTYVRRLPFHVALLVSITLLGLGRAEAARPAKVRPLPAAETVQSTLASVEAALPTMYVSHPFRFEGPYGTSGRDIDDYEGMAMEAFLDGTGEFAWAKAEPATKKEIHLVRYHLSDTRIAASLVRAKRLGIGAVTFTTDLNDAVERKQDYSTDFAAAPALPAGMGRTLTMLRDAGFRHGDARYGIFSNPLDRADRRALMHEKQLYLVVKGDDGRVKRAVGYGGSANLAVHAVGKDDRAVVTRYNRAFRCVDPAALDFELAHLRRMQEAFGAGKEIYEMVSVAPRRIEYKNGDVLELAYTDGKFNPNDRIVAFFEEAAASPDRIQVHEVVFSHFVGMTNAKIVDSLVKLMKAKGQPRFPVFGVFDDRFIGQRGYAHVQRLDGFDHLDPFGRLAFGVGSDVETRTTLFGYQRPIPGTFETELDGPPIARHVWHDKTTWVEVTVGGTRLVYVWTGSLNASSNFHNAERQAFVSLRAAEPLARAIRASIRDVVAAEPAYAIPLPIALLRAGIADLIGYGDLEVPVTTAERVAAAIAAKRFGDVIDEVRVVLKTETHITAKLAAKEIDGRLDRFRRFLDWHGAEFPHFYKSRSEVPLRKLLSVASVLSAPTMSPAQARDALAAAFWDWNAPTDEALRAKRVARAWELLGLPGTPPVREPRK